jgi:hypothetical protein
MWSIFNVILLRSVFNVACSGSPDWEYYESVSDVKTRQDSIKESGGDALDWWNHWKRPSVHFLDRRQKAGFEAPRLSSLSRYSLWTSCHWSHPPYLRTFWLPAITNTIMAAYELLRCNTSNEPGRHVIVWTVICRGAIKLRSARVPRT